MKKIGLLLLAGLAVTAVFLIAGRGLEPGAAAGQADPPLPERFVTGRNVNMVAGTKLPWGDPWLQRQNEPSMAVSSRNPLHLLAVANDYRTIDMPDDPRQLVPGIPLQIAQARDAWIGVFKSFDGGQSWITTLLHGYPQDLDGPATPIRGFDTACDPYVRAGANGLFFMSGIAFNRSGRAGSVFVSRWIDNNNLEKVRRDAHGRPAKDAIDYIDTKVIGGGNPGQFIDMPSLAVDVPRAGLGTSNIGGTDLPNARVFLAYTVFPGSTGKNVRSKLYFARSTNSGRTWYAPIKVSESQSLIQRAVIAVDPSDPTGRTIYIAFRRFLFDVIPDAIVVVKSVDGGATFTKPIVVATIPYAFDQLMNENRFRTNSYPSIAVDQMGIVSIVWAERRNRLTGAPDPAGQSRIVISSSADGVTWTAPVPVDPTDPGDTSGLADGHQVMPSLSYAGGRLMLAWYDQRDSLAKQTHGSAAVTEFIEDDPNADYRQTLDVRAAVAMPGLPPVFDPSQPVSRYLYYLKLGAEGDPEEDADGNYILYQAEHNPVNFPLFHQGTRPFVGDYIDLAASPQILPPPVTGGAAWMPNTDGANHPTSFHAAWADNRDVRPPLPDWWTGWPVYSPPDSDQPAPDLNKLYPCDPAAPNTAGRRNQNVYTASLSNGVQVGSAGNAKRLNIDGWSPAGSRTFTVFVRNLTEIAPRTFELSFGAVMPAGADVSFKQAGGQATRRVTVGPFSSASVTVYVARNTNERAPVKVDVREISGGQPPVLVGYALLNPDGLNPAVLDPDAAADLGHESHKPRISDPKVWKYDYGNGHDPHPGVMNPRALNPRALNSGQVNPRALNEDLENPRALNKSVTNENIVNGETANPRALNPRALNTALTDMTWTVTNDGNTTSCYQFDVVAQDNVTLSQYLVDGQLYGQLLIYRIHTTPIDSGCALKEEHHDELIVNVSNPRALNPRALNSTPTETGLAGIEAEGDEPDITDADATFWLAPDEQAYVIFRVYDPDTTDSIDFDPQMVAGEVEAQAVDTDAPGTDPQPEYATQPTIPWDPDPVDRQSEIGLEPATLILGAVAGADPAASYLTIWNAGGRVLGYTIEDDADWLVLAPATGQSASQADEQVHAVSVLAAGLSDGVYAATITISSPFAVNNPVRVPVTLTVYGTAPALSITTTAVRDGVRDDPYYALVESTGGIHPLSWSVVAGALPAGLALETTDGGTGLLIGTPTAAGTFTFTAQVQDNMGQTVTQPLSLTVADWLARYNGPGNGDDTAEGIAVDTAGLAHVTGISMGNATNFDYATIKYDAGDEVWPAALRYDGPAHGLEDGWSIAVDAWGNSYVTGGSQGVGTDFDLATVKYDSDGNQAWAVRHDGPGHGYDHARSVAVDAMGNVYITGHAWNGTDQDIITIKYSPDGSTLWTATYDGPATAGFDYGEALALHSSGAVYVTGYSAGIGTGDDIVILKYDRDGTQLWEARVNYANYLDRPTAIAVDAAGNVHVAGQTIGLGPGYSYAVIKYNAAGVLQWAVRYDGPLGDDSARDIAVDRTGNVYVTGESYSGGGSYDFATVKFDTGGTQLWAARYDGPAAGSDYAEALAIDPLGNVYVTGFSFVGGTDDYDYVTIAYDNDGTRLWAARYNGPASGNDRSHDLALDPLGSVIVTGFSAGTGTGLDYATIAYRQRFESQLIIATETLDRGDPGVPYAEAVWAFGGSGARTWSLASGNLPPGLGLDPATGIISGTPTAVGVYPFAVQVADGGLTAAMDLSITIGGPVITGQVRYVVHLSDGDVYNPIPNVIVHFSGGLGTATTDSSGMYTMPVPAGWTGAAVPSVGGTIWYNYTPAYRTYAAVTSPMTAQNYDVGPIGLAFNNHPGDTVVGEVISPAIVVFIGAATPGVTVTISLGANPGGGTLTGAGNYLTGSDGSVTLTGLSIDAVGSGYTIVAESGGYRVSSLPFNVTIIP